jgi:antitoxin component YwqK of YwqJK toxin-antitoxin module
MRKGVLYQMGETSPYSGFVIGKDRKGYRGKTRQFKKQYKEGVLCGKSEFWYSNGKLEGIEPYKDGKIHGITSRYYDNGQIRSRIHFVDGLRGGNKGEFFWERNGKLKKG